jgi:hypothetical protein
MMRNSGRNRAGIPGESDRNSRIANVARYASFISIENLVTDGISGSPPTKDGAMSLKRTLILLILAGLDCGCSKSPIGPGPDAAAVDVYLKNHLQGAKYEIVQWWPGVDSERAHAAKLKSLKAAIEKCEAAIQSSKALIEEIKAGREAGGVVRNAWEVETELASSIKSLAILQKDAAALAQRHTARICRLRFLSKNAVGKTVVNDRIFEIEAGKASPIDSRSDYEQPEYEAALAVFGN